MTTVRKIAIIGSTRYARDMALYASELRDMMYTVNLPSFDSPKRTELETAKNNREAITWADEVHVFWDRVSMGTVFDLGMAFALGKRVRIKKLEKRTFSGLFRQISEDSLSEED